jgi:predicted DCC family thiol-disulfide oxidoreductase YuxK
MATSTISTTLLYDGRCVLCVNTVRWLRRLDWRRRLAYVDVQDTDFLRANYPAIAQTQALSEIHVVLPSQRILRGYFGMRHVIRHLPLLMWLYPLLYLPGITWLGPRIYALVAKNRYRWFGYYCEDGVCKR